MDSLLQTLSIWSWLIILLVLTVPAWIFSRALVKSGLSGWWALLGLIPLANIVGLWVFAFAEWPNFPAGENKLQP
jgi:uncharacterized membrane protein YhaH (DUF805 family)